MDRVMLKEKSKQQIAGQIGIFLLIYLAFLGIVLLLDYFPVIGSGLSFVATALLELQIIKIHLDLTRGTAPEFIRLFDIFKKPRLCGNTIVLNLMVSVLTFFWTLLLIVPGIIKSLSYAMAPFILADNEDMLPQDAIKESMRIMDGHKMELFILELSFIGWEIVCVLTLGIAAVYVLPYYQTTIANFYNEIKNTPVIETGFVE